MTPFEAIYWRKSVRRYTKDPVPEEILKTIKSYEAELIPMFPMIHWAVRIYTSSDYGKFEKGLFAVEAPYYLMVYAQELDDYKVNAGNVAEQIALYLHSRGIGTCFQGMMKPPKGDIAPEGMAFVIALAFGYPKEEPNRDEERAKRLPLDRLCVYKQEPMDTTLKLLEAARLAPSSMNCQPWKFVVYKNRIHIFSTQKHDRRTKAFRDINMGIMIAHMLMAADEYWIDLTMTRSENLAEKTVPNYTYLGSVLLKL